MISAEEFRARRDVSKESRQPLPVDYHEEKREDLPTIQVTTDEKVVADAVLKALGNKTGIYQRGGMLVHIIFDSQTDESMRIIRVAGAPHPRPIPFAWMREMVAHKARFEKRNAKGDLKEIHVPTWVVDAVLARGKWDFPHLAGVTEAPMLRPDGTILETPGYDKETGLYYVPSTSYPKVPTVPTRGVALEALGRLEECIVDFPFETPAHRSAWLAALLSPFTRFAFVGPAPLVLIDANVRGSGKSNLASIIAKICTGRDFARCPQSEDPEEERKRITTVALEGDRIVLFDDVVNLGGKALDAALTSTTWKERILGKSESSGELPLIVTWFATGNNVNIREDISRRILHVRLDSPLERPEERPADEFKHPDLMKWVDENRAQLAVDCLTLLRAFYVEGRPSQKLETWGSFERWSGIIRDCLVWLGLPDPGLTRQGLREGSDSTTSAIADFLRGWKELCDRHQLRGATTSFVAKELNENSNSFTTLRNAVAELGTNKAGLSPTPRSIGLILKKIRGRRVGGMRIDSKTVDGNRVWQVES